MDSWRETVRGIGRGLPAARAGETGFAGCDPEPIRVIPQESHNETLCAFKVETRGPMDATTRMPRFIVQEIIIGSVPFSAGKKLAGESLDLCQVTHAEIWKLE